MGPTARIRRPWVYRGQRRDFFKNLQVVVDETLPNFKEAVRLPVGTAVRVAGELESPGAGQPLNLEENRSR